MPCLGPREASQPGRGNPVSPTKPPFALLEGFPRKTILLWIAPRRGGLCTPAMKALASPGHIAARPQRRRLSLGDCDIPRACVRPVFTGAETAPLPENRLSRHLRTLRAGRSVLGRPCREGAGSARPECPHNANPNVVFSRPRTSRQLVHNHALPRACVRPSHRGRGDRVPPRTPTSALSKGFPRKAILPWMAHPAEGRALHVRIGRHGLDRGMCPLGHRLIVSPSAANGMPRH